MKALSPKCSKLGEMYANVAKEAFKPVEGAIAKVKASAN